MSPAARVWMPLGAHAVLVQVFTYAFRPGLSYAVLDAGGEAILLGLLGTAFAIPALALALPAGRFVDAVGARKTAVAGGVVLAAAAAIALLGSGSVPLLVLATFALGIGHLLSVVSEQAVVSHLSAPGARDNAFGAYTFMVSVGQIVGPLLLAMPAPAGAQTPWLAGLFTTCAVIAVLIGAGSALLPLTPRTPKTEQGNLFAASRSLLRIRGVLPILVSSSIALASVDVTLAFWPALGEERGFPVVVISVMLSVRALSTMASRALLPWLARRVPREHLMAGSLLVSALGLGAVALPLPQVALLVAAALYGLAIGLSQPMTMSWLTDVAPAGQRGMTLSLRLAGNRVGQSTIPAIVGSIALAAGAVGVVALSAASLVAASVISLRRPPRPDAP